MKLIIRPTRQWFGRNRKRRQYRFEIVAGNNRPISDKDTYANPTEIVDVWAKFRNQPVTYEIHTPDGQVTEGEL